MSALVPGLGSSICTPQSPRICTTQANPFVLIYITHLHLEGLGGVQQVGAAGAWAGPAVQVHPHLQNNHTTSQAHTGLAILSHRMITSQCDAFGDSILLTRTSSICIGRVSPTRTDSRSAPPD